jgi:hypothetical protein
MQMPVLTNAKYERFAQLLAQGKSAVEAYERAGYRRDDGNAVRLTKKPAITGRVQELTGQAAEKAKITVETLLRQADEIRRRAMESHQYSAAVAAIREMGVLSGARIERKEIGAPGEFDHLSDDELLAALRERFAKLESELH